MNDVNWKWGEEAVKKDGFNNTYLFEKTIQSKKTRKLYLLSRN